MMVYLVVRIICNWRPLLLFLRRLVSARYCLFKPDGSDVYAYILCTWWSGVVATKTGFKLIG